MYPFYSTDDDGAGKELFGNGKPQTPPPAGGTDTGVGGSRGVGGWTNEGVNTTPGGGLDLSDTRRIITNTGTGPMYGEANSEALMQYAGGANDLASHYSQQGASAQGRQGEQIVNPHDPLDRMYNAQAQDQQTNALGLMQGAAMGNAPSQASIQMQNGLNQSLAGQIAAANSARGGGANVALAQRNAAAGGDQMRSQMMGQQAALRANEMAQARGAYSNAADTYRSANQAAYNADQNTAFQQAGINSAQRAQNDQYQQGYEGMGLSALQGQQSSDTAKYGADRGVSIANDNRAASNTAAAVGAGAATLGAIAKLASDERLKTDVSRSGSKPSSLADIYRSDPYADTSIIRDNPYVSDDGPSGSGGIIRDNPYGSDDDDSTMASDKHLKTGISSDSPSARTKQPYLLPGELASHRTGTRGQVTQFASDEDLKTGNAPGARAQHEADEFLASLHPSSYRYKDNADSPAGPGRYLGVMAQDVEKGPTGSTLVKDTPRGKMLDVPANLSAALGGIGRLNERLAQLESEHAAMKGKK